jgi:hypothetical protein
LEYAAFWERYLRAHSQPSTHVLHYLGSVLALPALIFAA